MVTLLDPLQEGGAVAAAAVTVLEQLVVHAKHLLGERLKTLPPLPQAVEGLGKHKQKENKIKETTTPFSVNAMRKPCILPDCPGVSTDSFIGRMPSLMGALINELC